MYIFLVVINFFSVIVKSLKKLLIIPKSKHYKNISRKAIERLDLLLLALETIDLNATESMFSISNKLKLEDIFPNKVSIWQLRCNNPMRKTFTNSSISNYEFEALILVTTEMSKYLYPYIRSILLSKDNYSQDPKLWDDFKSRYISLIEERFNTQSIKVKKLLNHSKNNNFFARILITLAMSISDESNLRLKSILTSL